MSCHLTGLALQLPDAAGNNPKKVMTHLSKCFQAIDKLLLKEGSQRPSGTGIVSCVGTETCVWSSPLALDGKVEQYMNAIIDKMRSELKTVLFQSMKAYHTKKRTEWQFDWPSQVILVVSQMFWCQEVEEAFAQMGQKKSAMSDYNKKQVQQLTDLIQVTRTDLKKPDRQKVMNMITIDAHSRDMIEQVVDSGCEDPNSFQWVCQLRTYWDKSIDDCRIRICDAAFPYGYEYLGNGPRLVITPLTDRIYITATQVWHSACFRCLKSLLAAIHSPWLLHVCMQCSDEACIPGQLPCCKVSGHAGMLAVSWHCSGWPSRHGQDGDN
jgi:dynein heavy chain, axonemal